MQCVREYGKCVCVWGGWEYPLVQQLQVPHLVGVFLLQLGKRLALRLQRFHHPLVHLSAQHTTHPSTSVTSHNLRNDIR